MEYTTEQTETIQELQNKIEGKRKIISQCDADIKETQLRLKTAEERQGKIEPEYEAAKLERQRILADKRDPQRITVKLRSLKEEVELVGDEIAGLTVKLDRLRVETLPKAKNDLLQAADDLLGFRAQCIVPEYNAMASKFAELVREVRDLSMEINSPSRRFIVSSMGWEDNALDKIPKLFLPDEPISDSDKYSIFHFLMYRDTKQARYINAMHEAR